MYLNAMQLISIICYSVFSNLLSEVLIMFLHENHSRVKFTMCEVSLSDASPKMMSYCSVLFFWERGKYQITKLSFCVTHQGCPSF